MASRNGPRSSTFRGREKKHCSSHADTVSCRAVFWSFLSSSHTCFFNRSSWLSQTPPIIPPDAVLHCDRANQWWHRFPAWWLLSPQSVRKRLGETNCSMSQIKLPCMKKLIFRTCLPRDFDPQNFKQGLRFQFRRTELLNLFDLFQNHDAFRAVPPRLYFFHLLLWMCEISIGLRPWASPMITCGWVAKQVKEGSRPTISGIMHLITWTPWRIAPALPK